MGEAMKVIWSLLVAVVCVMFAPLEAHASKGLPFFVNIDSLAVPGFSGPKTYVLLPLNSDASSDELLYESFVPYVVEALKTHGLTRVQEGAHPDLVVYLDYGVGDPRKQLKTTSFPIFGQTGIAGASTTATRFGNTLQATTTFIPSFGITGFSNSVHQFTTYTKYIGIQGYFSDGLNDKGEPRPAFRTNLTEFGESADLRRAFPVMIAAALRDIATTAPSRTQGIRENHRSVQKFKKSVAQAGGQ